MIWSDWWWHLTGSTALQCWEHPTPVLLPGKSHGRRSLEGCSSWGCWGSDTTERLHFHFSLSCTGEGNGNPLQCSCLENPSDGGARWAAVYGVAQSRTRLKCRTKEVWRWKQGEQWGATSRWDMMVAWTWAVKVQMVKGGQILDWLINLAINYHHLEFKVNLFIENIWLMKETLKSHKPKHKATLQISNPLFSWWQDSPKIFFYFLASRFVGFLVSWPETEPGPEQWDGGVHRVHWSTGNSLKSFLRPAWIYKLFGMKMT